MTSNLATTLATVPERAADHRFPGAAVAVHLDGALQQAAAGIADLDSAAPVTSQTVFGVWSVAKIFTAAVFAGLSATGQVDLDAPASRYLPELAAAEQGRDGITIAQLLSHTSGLDGDAIIDLGDGDDCRQRYVRGLARVPQLFAPGSAYGYCNAGYIVLGALAERVTATTWEDLVQTVVLDPAGLSHTTPRGRGDAPGPVAGAHVLDAQGELRATTTQYAPWRSCAPCGSSTYATAPDLARFGALVPPVLRRPVIPIPGYEYEQRTSCLGWKSLDWSGTRILAHDGGAHTFLRVVPEAGLSIAIMVNGPGGPQFAEPLITDLVETVTGARPPQRPQPATPPRDLNLGRYAGIYGATGLNATIADTGGTLTIKLGTRIPEPVPLAYLTPTTFAVRGTTVSFTGFDHTGRPHLVHIGGSRAAARTTP